MRDYYEDRGLKGFANWYMVQVQEEVSHAKILRRYLLDNDAQVKMLAIAEPDKVFTDDLAPLLAGQEHERYITECINRCYAAAADVRDFRTMQLLDWFVKEQGEEETNASDMVKNMQLFGSDPKGLYDLTASTRRASSWRRRCPCSRRAAGVASGCVQGVKTAASGAGCGLRTGAAPSILSNCVQSGTNWSPPFGALWQLSGQTMNMPASWRAEVSRMLSCVGSFSYAATRRGERKV